MNFDLRYPVGLMFSIFGLILASVGLFGHPDLDKSLGINMNLWWGMALLVFGVFMLLMAMRGSARKP